MKFIIGWDICVLDVWEVNVVFDTDAGYLIVACEGTKRLYVVEWLAIFELVVCVDC